MILCKENSAIILNNMQNIDVDVQNLVVQVKNMFSKYLKKPRILLNITPKIEILTPLLKKIANVKIVSNSCIGIFTYITHFGGYDLGIFAEEKDNEVRLKFYSGSGYPLSLHEFSYFENTYSESIKTNIHKKYKITDFNLIMEGKKDRFATKWANQYIDFLKNIIKKKNVSVISNNTFENYIFSSIFDCDDANIKIYCGNKLYAYKKDRLIDLQSSIDKNLCLKEYNENYVIKYLLENQMDYIVYDNDFYVIKNAFDFENISKAVFVVDNFLE